MLGIPRRYGHYVFGFLQAGITCAVASGIATSRMPGPAMLEHWLASWLIAWASMIPVVLVAAPAIRRLADALTVAD